LLSINVKAVLKILSTNPKLRQVMSVNYINRSSPITTTAAPILVANNDLKTNSNAGQRVRRPKYKIPDTTPSMSPGSGSPDYERLRAPGAIMRNRQQEGIRKLIKTLPSSEAQGVGALDFAIGLSRVKNLAATTYQPMNSNLKNTYITLVDPKKERLVIASLPTDKASALNPNPEFKNQEMGEWRGSIASGTAPVADASRVTAIINGGFFNRYGERTTGSFASKVNGEIQNTGKIEPGAKKVLSWNNDGSPFKMASWNLNTGSNQNGKAIRQQPYAPVVAALSGSKNAIIGFDPLKADIADKVEAGITMMGVNKRGEAAMFVSEDTMTAREAAKILSDAGFTSAVLLDAGNSSQARHRHTTNFKGDEFMHSVLSKTARRIPNVLVLEGARRY
jgi:Phosphodiester glycosidase